MRVESDLKGINVTHAKLADGTRKTYYYAWRDGPRLEGEPGSEEFIASYKRAIAVEKPSDKVMDTIIDAYLDSTKFKSRSASTQRDYSRYIVEIREEFGEFPLAGLEEDEARAEFLAWRDDVSERGTRAADYAWTVLNVVINWAIAQRKWKIRTNPCEKAGRLWGGSRAEFIWTDAQEDAFMAVASPQIGLAFQLGIWTGQRQRDLLRLPWSAYDGERINLKQSKTGAYVSILAGKPLRELLDATPRRGVQIVLNEDGIPYTGSGFRASFRKTRIRGAIQGVTFHDLRGTTVTRLASLGCTEIEIASITGHMISVVKSILEKHYLAKSQRLGDNAIRRLEESRSTR